MMGKSSPRFNDLPLETMSSNEQENAPELPASGRAPLPAPALRALAEAEARRRDYREAEAAQPKELGGRGGKEPVRYGDWEVKGLASDF